MQTTCPLKTLPEMTMTRRFGRSDHSHCRCKNGRRAALLLALCCVSGVAVGAADGPPPAAVAPAPAPKAAARPPWDRIVMIGASASAGFTESEPLGGPNSAQYRLSRYVEAALSVPHEPVQNLANAMFFIQPEAAGRHQLDQALKSKPTLVIGVDFLFWFC